MRKSFELEKKTIVLMSFDKRYKYYMRAFEIANDDSNKMQKTAIETCKYIEERYPDTLNAYIEKIKPKVVKLIEEAFAKSRTGDINHFSVRRICDQLFNKGVVPPFVCKGAKNKFTAKGFKYFGNYNAVPDSYNKGTNIPKSYKLIKTNN